MCNEEEKRTISNKEKDLEFVRQQYLELLRDNRAMIDVMMDLARESESARVFEVLSNSIKTSADVADRIIELHKSNKELSKSMAPSPNGSGNNGGTTNNNLFIGSTSDLQRMLANMNNNNNNNSIVTTTPIENTIIEEDDGQ